MTKRLVACFLAAMLLLSVCAAASAEDAPVAFSIGLRVSSDFNPEGNALCEAIDQATNSKIDWIIWPSSNWLEKRNVSLASNDYPDVIMLDERRNDTMYANLVKADKLVALDDYLAGAPNIMAYTLESAWVAQRDPGDGKLYSVPRCTIVREDFMMVRKDWMDALGFEALETTEDWIAFCEAVATQDPDENGVNDTYGVTSRGGLGELVSSYFLSAFNAKNGWYDDGTGVIFNGKYSKDGRFKDVLAFYQTLYENGSIDPEFLTYKGYYEDKLNQGVVASYLGFIGNMDRELVNTRVFCPEAELVFVPYPTDAQEKHDGETPILTNSGVYFAWGITDKGADRAQHIIDTFDWLLSDKGWEMLRFGVEGVHYNMNGGERAFTDLYYSEQTANEQLMIFRRPLDEAFWLKNRVPEIYDYQVSWLKQSVDYIQDNYRMEGLLGFTATNETAFLSTDLITTEEPILIAEIITGEKPLEAWDEFLEKVYASGYEDIVAEYNAYYAAHQN